MPLEIPLLLYLCGVLSARRLATRISNIFGSLSDLDAAENSHDGRERLNCVFSFLDRNLA